MKGVSFMYFTQKVRIKLTKEEKQLLFLYECIYHQQIDHIVNQMNKLKKVSYSYICFDENIHSTSRWLLYKLAHKKYDALKENRHFQYERSSSWSPTSFLYQYGKLRLKFGKTFKKQDCVLFLSFTEFEKSILEENRMVRMDIVHDEIYWFANFTLEKK